MKCSASGPSASIGKNCSNATISTTPISTTTKSGPCVGNAPSDGGAFLSGMIWGFLPCGMVYGALFYAMLAGSTLGGAEVMAGFALGTLPSVTAVALGLSGFRRLGEIKRARIAVGLAIMVIAALSVAAPVARIAALCGVKI